MLSSPIKTYAGYIRVSTAKQGEKGVSLQEQRAAIEAYASRNRLTISEWFEERVTAAKRGRPVFNQMLMCLRKRKIEGIVIHKIDRSARNLKDWADLGELIDSGIQIHLAGDSLDLQTRGGRLSADIQAVVAADFIRNLREETRKGMYGRLKQGLYPLPAPVGYLNQGKGKPKTVDPFRGPLVRRLFELYAQGTHSLDTLVIEAKRLGLTSRTGWPITRSTVSRILNNPFYAGLLRLGTTRETFPGVHTPLISMRQFETVQGLLRGKIRRVSFVHSLPFRGLLNCGSCLGLLTGELHKGHVYYCCHNRQCLAKASVRQETVEKSIRGLLSQAHLTDHQIEIAFRLIAHLREEWGDERNRRKEQIRLQLRQTRARLDRLIDSHLEGLLEDDVFCGKKTSLLSDIARLEDDSVSLNDDSTHPLTKLEKCFELAKSALLTYELGNQDQKRQLVEIASSNRSVFGKDVVVEPSNPFRLLLDQPTVPECDPYRDSVRTLLDWFNTKEGFEFSLRLDELRL